MLPRAALDNLGGITSTFSHCAIVMSTAAVDRLRQRTLNVSEGAAVVLEHVKKMIEFSGSGMAPLPVPSEPVDLAALGKALFSDRVNKLVPDYEDMYIREWDGHIMRYDDCTPRDDEQTCEVHVAVVDVMLKMFFRYLMARSSILEQLQNFCSMYATVSNMNVGACVHAHTIAETRLSSLCASKRGRQRHQ